MQTLSSTLQRVVQDVFTVDIQPELTRPDEQFGDYATNVALQLAGRLRRNPREVAEELRTHLEEVLKDMAKSVAVAGPGFINITLSDAYIADMAAQSPGARSGRYADQVVVIETNNPNPFKDLHIGHAYNSIVADTVANLLEAGQATVHRVSYHGDVGLHVGKSMWAIVRYAGGDIAKLKDVPEAERPGFLSRMYAEGATAYEEDDLAKQQIEELAKQSFDLTDPQFTEVYELCKTWSFDYFDQIFSRIGSKPVERRYLERETDAAGRQTVEEHIGDIFEQSEGAVVFKGEKYGFHTRVFISSRGTTLYEARDLGLIRLKADEYSPQSSYIVTAIEQKEYFNVVLKAAELCLPQYAGQTHNIATGTVKLSTGKMSSRTGKVVNIGWLFDELEKALRERGTEGEAMRQAVIGALRYTMLRNRVENDTIFDVSDSISLEGNSGPYLQYAHARAKSILAKGKAQPAAAITAFEPAERSLIRKVSEYPEVVERAVAELLPHHVSTYLYELAQAFNRFYEHNRVVGDPREAERLRLVQLYADVLKDGLGLLGITAPDRM